MRTPGILVIFKEIFLEQIFVIGLIETVAPQEAVLIARKSQL
jgi:hypothetical protein